MKIYNYNYQTKEFTTETDAELSPLELDKGEEVFLIPAHATDKKPPAVGLGYVAVFNGTDWEVQEDWRNRQLFSTETGDMVVVTKIGPKSDNTTQSPRPTPSHKWIGDGWVLDLDHYKTAKLNDLEKSRNDAIDMDVTSDALGQSHTYSAKAINRQFLNSLITLGGGSKFTCSDNNGVKARIYHTPEQLMILAVDIQASINSKFDHFETLASQVSSARDQSEVDAIVW